MIEMKNVAAGYGKNQVLHGVNLRAKQGKITHRELFGGSVPVKTKL